VTLELGGKSPVYVDKTATIGVAVNRIIGTKLFNNGQICVAPDYVMVHESIAKEFVQALKDKIIFGVGENPQKSPSLGRLVSQHHFDRIKNLLADNHGGEVIIGGLQTADRADKFIPPTIILNPRPNSLIMTEEIFGPVLPVLVVRGENEFIDFVNSRECPLALYVFGEDSAVQEKILNQTLAGGSCINDCVFHVTNPNLPFGGVGTAGFGAYHGKAGFEEMSHRRAVMYRSTWIDPSARYMPYKAEDVATMKKIVIGPLIPPMLKNAVMVGGALGGNDYDEIILIKYLYISYNIFIVSLPSLTHSMLFLFPPLMLLHLASSKREWKTVALYSYGPYGELAS
jgi:delta 1-pyrroline-5-carboxylate dehydrogenase